MNCISNSMRRDKKRERERVIFNLHEDETVYSLQSTKKEGKN